jgi:hypothetical protein
LKRKRKKEVQKGNFMGLLTVGLTSIVANFVIVTPSPIQKNTENIKPARGEFT